LRGGERKKETAMARRREGYREVEILTPFFANSSRHRAFAVSVIGSKSRHPPRAGLIFVDPLTEEIYDLVANGRFAPEDHPLFDGRLRPIRRQHLCLRADVDAA
jgi:hypothetical protein